MCNFSGIGLLKIPHQSSSPPRSVHRQLNDNLKKIIYFKKHSMIVLNLEFVLAENIFLKGKVSRVDELLFTLCRRLHRLDNNIPIQLRLFNNVNHRIFLRLCEKENTKYVYILNCALSYGLLSSILYDFMKKILGLLFSEENINQY